MNPQRSISSSDWWRIQSATPYTYTPPHLLPAQQRPSHAPPPALPGIHNLTVMTSHAGPPPNDPAPMQELVTIFLSALEKIDTHLSARLSRMEVAYEALAKVTSDITPVTNVYRQETKEGLDRLHGDIANLTNANRKETKEGLDHLHALVLNLAKSSRANADRVAQLLGEPTSEEKSEAQTVFSRIEQLERAVVELTETVSDPDAARPVVVRHEAGVNTSPVSQLLVQTDCSMTDAATPVASTNFILKPPVSRPSQALRIFREVHSSSPFVVQPLGPAQWTPRTGTSDDSDSSSKRLSPPIPEVVADDGPVNIPSPSEGRESSLFEEEEILLTLREGLERPSQSPQNTPLPKSTLLQPEAAAVVTQTSILALAQPPVAPLPPQQTNQTVSADDPPQKASPPLPRRSTLLAAASASAYKPTARITVPLPRGLRKAAPDAGTAAPPSATNPQPSSSLSSLSHPAATEANNQGTRGRSDSLSSLSSLSSPSSAGVQTQSKTRAFNVLQASSGSAGASSISEESCEAWYHFGCVGLEIGDPRLEPDAEFFCPPCESSDSAREQRQSLSFQEAACVRPDCDRAGLAEETNEYFVERIIGRRPYDSDVAAKVKRPDRFLWLVKWDGWKAEYASWTEREHLGDCAKLIEDFEQAAEIEGRDLSRLDHVIVLNEGAAVGW
ncbi:hypothetical protein BN946_scf184569.g39 [Trametes cinnabarina]|uniref:Chromo domain-containing protein n=1 Tax=Pycnoporus cinnabarinus TaxID=5643 RepID=A0A060S8C8_PYCCI|nr:hypothetical protein BN946_scf184569.g39 [Trametes cinnabarina]